MIHMNKSVNNTTVTEKWKKQSMIENLQETWMEFVLGRAKKKEKKH